MLGTSDSHLNFNKTVKSQFLNDKQAAKKSLQALEQGVFNQEGIIAEILTNFKERELSAFIENLGIL